jgi:hypothetical protein
VLAAVLAAASVSLVISRIVSATPAPSAAVARLSPVPASYLGVY